jgi:type VI secretion system FHA domain protein
MTAMPPTSIPRPPELGDLDRGPPTDAFFEPHPAHPQTASDAAGVATFSAAEAFVSPFSPIPETWAEALQPARQAAAAPVPVGTADTPARMDPLIVIPTDWDAASKQAGAPNTKPVERIPSTAAQAPAAVTPVPPAPVAGAASPPATGDSGSASEVVAAFCAGAGLDPSVLAGSSPAETGRRAGELLRIAVEGLMDVLASRRSLKSEFRLSATEFRPAENNPLKFSVDADQAMQMLMGRPQRGFLQATEAFREAVDDLRTHELAILAGMQEAWLIQLQRFNPRDLSDRLEGDSGLVNLLGLKKARCWDAFVTPYDSIAGKPDNEWERTFQNIFGAAYERSMQKQRKRSG